MSADIDIDVPDRNQLLQLIEHTPACQITKGQLRKHNSGIYVTEIPVDPTTGTAAFDYTEADERGYFKLDILNMSVYQLVRDPEHYQRMLAAEPPWSRLWEDVKWTEQVVHIGSYSELLNSMRPDSITRMAAFISIIRPGKAHLQGRSWSDVFATVWDGDSELGYTFKQSHAISYAALIALHMNLLNEQQPKGYCAQV